jgi:chromosome segregation ATPase
MDEGNRILQEMNQLLAECRELSQRFNGIIKEYDRLRRQLHKLNAVENKTETPEGGILDAF